MCSCYSEEDACSRWRWVLPAWRDPWLFSLGLFAQCWIGDELWRLLFVGDGEEREVA
jgi:hypothetical protein